MSTQNTSEQLKDIIVEAIENLKAIDVQILPVAHLTSLTDYMIICTGSSNRHVHAIANNAATTIKEHNYPISLDGERNDDWVLVDAGDVILHVMLADTRAYYDLESLWQA